MIASYLMRGMLAGVVAGLLTFGFAKVFGEPQVDQAISFETQLNGAGGHEHSHDHGSAASEPAHAHDTALAAPAAPAVAAEPAEAEEVSRETQSGIGLLTGTVVYGAAAGGLFALVFAYAYGRAGKLAARPLSALLALAAFIVLVIVPNLKYPANPPSVGVASTIGFRTGLFFLMIAISIATAVFSLKARRYAVARLGVWNGTIATGVLFVAIIAAVQLNLPAINEVPAAFPAVLLWKFRIVAIGMQAILWAAIGLLFGAWAERAGHPAVHVQNVDRTADRTA